MEVENGSLIGSEPDSPHLRVDLGPGLNLMSGDFTHSPNLSRGHFKHIWGKRDTDMTLFTRRIDLNAVD